MYTIDTHIFMGVPCMYIFVILTILLMVIFFLMILLYFLDMYRRLRLESNKVCIRIRIRTENGSIKHMLASKPKYFFIRSTSCLILLESWLFLVSEYLCFVCLCPQIKKVMDV